MVNIRDIRQIIFGPKLYKKYRSGQNHRPYEPLIWEKWGDHGIQLISLLWNFGFYTSPVAATVYVYRRGLLVFEGLGTGGEQFLNIMWNIATGTSPLSEIFTVLNNLGFIPKIAALMGVLATSSFTLRTIGRITNPSYMEFYNCLKTAQARKDFLDSETKKKLMQYEFDFAHWPVEFTAVGNARANIGSVRSSRASTPFFGSFLIPCRLIRFIVNYFAIRMVYPGSIKALQSVMSSALMEGRSKLMNDFNAERFKLQGNDNNEIDVIFVDRRPQTNNTKRNTLVVCCEGNCGFYEVGCMMTAIEAKYSVLGWNHPGFGGSTGSPFPDQEQNAIDVVMQFAINRLQFSPDNIILYGWSIGGFTSSSAAVMYKDVKGLILDATFDDILPLALSRMPRLLEPLIRFLIREDINLVIHKLVAQYPGPITFIRRSEDEMICTEDGNYVTNRGNHLAAKILTHRYPELLDSKRQTLLEEWLASDQLHRRMLRDRYHVDNDLCTSLIISYVQDNSLSYPMRIGDGLSDEHKAILTIFLAEKYVKEYRSTHCTPLPVTLFEEPWIPAGAVNEAGFVTV